MELRVTDSTARQVEIPGLGVETYIVENKPLESLLFDRELTGLPFCDVCESASERFFRHINPCLPKNAQGSIAELMILSKGRYYFLHNAFRKVRQENLECNYVATQRRTGESGISAQNLYQSFLAPAENLVVGDTIATGVTGRLALEAYFRYHTPKQVFFFSYYGAWRGATQIFNVCQEFGVKLYLLFGLAAFGLADNGFDLSFLHPDTICDSKYTEKAHVIFKGTQMSALGWDFGSQSQSVSEYNQLYEQEKRIWNF